jgi:hypothetical protein
MSKTAVNYLIDELSQILGPIQTTPMQDLLMVDAITKAKAMEKQQIMNAVDYGTSDWGSYKDPEVYYNETYNNKTK